MSKKDTRLLVLNLLKPYIKTPYEVCDNENLYYELFFSPELKVYKYSSLTKLAKEEDEVFYNPKRGYSAFQTDIIIYELINENKLPRIVIECKSDLSSHDIITYNAKAEMHKRIYPWLRYGIIDVKLSKVPIKFFTHNSHLDFFIAGNDIIENNSNEIIQSFITDEINASKLKEQFNIQGINCNIFQMTFKINNR